MALLAEPFFARSPPKSTGRDLFHGDWLDARLAGRALAPADVQATLVALTVALPSSEPLAPAHRLAFAERAAPAAAQLALARQLSGAQLASSE